MNHVATIYFRTAAVLLVIGMAAGLVMSVSGDHRGSGAHAHFTLIGFVLTVAYGSFFAFDPERSRGRLPVALLWLHAGGAAAMFVSLWLLVTGVAVMQPVVALSSVAVLAAAVLFGWIVWMPAPAGRPVTPARA